MAQQGGKREGAGRKKGLATLLAEKSRDYIAKRVEKEQKPIIDKAIEQAKAGDAKAREFLYDRAHGRVPQPITGEGGIGPVAVQISEVVAKKNNIDV